MSYMTSVLHQSDTLCQRRRYYSYEGRESNHEIHIERGSIPKESLVRGSIPKRRYPFPLISKGGR
jgi:hypothetical protein